MYKTQSSDLIYDNYSLNVLSLYHKQMPSFLCLSIKARIKGTANNKSHLNEW